METVNLYGVSVKKLWIYFVFSKSANRARSICVHHESDEEYIDLSAFLLRKDVGGKTDVIVDCEEDDDYCRVVEHGFGYAKEEDDFE